MNFHFDMSDTKKLHDTLAVLVNMLKGCEERLQDPYYIPIWPDLEKQRIDLQNQVNNIKKVLLTVK
jgi:hypothetical protein